MTFFHALGLCGAFAFAACGTTRYRIDAGYTQLSVSGDVALATGTGGVGNAVEQDIRSGFGLGDDVGSPFLRAAADFDGPTASASGFLFHEQGAGVLDANFGGLLSATPVTSELEFGSAKLTAAWRFDLGPVSIAPGLAFDVFDFDFRANDQAGNAEIIDELVAVPLVMLRGEATLGSFFAAAEAGYIEASTGSAGTSSFFDAEGTLGWSPTPTTRLVVGYRFIEVDAKGDTGTESFGLDVRIEGWYLGGGVTL